MKGFVSITLLGIILISGILISSIISSIEVSIKNDWSLIKVNQNRYSNRINDISNFFNDKPFDSKSLTPWSSLYKDFYDWSRVFKNPYFCPNKDGCNRLYDSEKISIIGHLNLSTLDLPNLSQIISTDSIIINKLIAHKPLSIISFSSIAIDNIDSLNLINIYSHKNIVIKNSNPKILVHQFLTIQQIALLCNVESTNKLIYSIKLN